MNDPVHVVWDMHRNSEFTLIFFGKVMFIFRNTENPTSYAPEHRKIPIDRSGKLSQSFLFLSLLVCEVVVLLCYVWYRGGVQCVCVCVCLFLKCFLFEQSVHFQYFCQVCVMQKMSLNVLKKIYHVNNAMLKNKIQNRVLSGASLLTYLLHGAESLRS